MGLLIHSVTPLPTAHLAVTLSLLILGLGFGYVFCIAAYNVLFHPLRKFPGPKVWAMSRIPYTRMILSGKAPPKILKMHETYGRVVRVGPNILAFSHPDAVKQIRGHRKPGMGEHGKLPFNFGPLSSTIIGAGRAEHTRYRRALAHGFSAQAMLDQQPIITQYVDTFIQRLYEECAAGKQSVDVAKWFNYTTFDIIGDLAFGEPFGCLKDSTNHPWVAIIFESIKNLAFATNIQRFPPFAPLLRRFIIPKSLATKLDEHIALSRAKVRKRLSTQTDRPDFVTSMTTKRESSKGGELTFDELTDHSSLLITAGSETTATALSAAAYYLALEQRPLTILNEEVRSTFATEEEIDLISVQKLTYMLAVLDEAIRMFPPAPGAQPRVICEGGDTIAGEYIPAGTQIDAWQWSVHHDPSNFTQPDDFIPERWLGDPRFANDKRDVFQPFSFGPRNCIGKNLAYSEMRLILARLVWNFDIQLVEGTKGWDERANVYNLWQKGPVNVYLTPRKVVS